MNTSNVLTKLDLVIVVPFFQNSIQLFRLLDSINFKAFNTRTNLVVVNNDIKIDKNVKKIVTSYSEKIIFLHEPTAGSYSARNYAIKKVPAKYYFFVDSDCIFHETTMQTLNSLVSDGTSYGVICGKTTIFNNSFDIGWHYDNFFAFNFKALKKSKTGLTCNLFVSENSFSTYGLFDSSMMSGGDYKWTKNYSIFEDIIYNDSLLILHPSRTKNDVISKALRIIGGRYKLLPRYKFIFELMMPSLRRMHLIITSSISYKLKINLILFLNYIKILCFFEGIFLLAGKNPRRK